MPSSSTLMEHTRRERERESNQEPRINHWTGPQRHPVCTAQNQEPPPCLSAPAVFTDAVFTDGETCHGA